ncbi:GD12758 [Drosophila simulans]|uniref:GD12758 n=1 Tax=Drosophila simulans TaxID=7240 RepID=B4QQR1_DROSI|nr:GD12758 [Drosophila simulans]
MLPFRLGLLLLGAVLFVASANGAAIENEATSLNDLQREKRSGRGYSRGQTQSQYLNFGKPEEDGKAEAEATENGSRSTVSGTHGMGQAQSQFSSGDCNGCSGYQTDYPSSGRIVDASGSGGIGRPDSIISLPGGGKSYTFKMYTVDKSIFQLLIQESVERALDMELNLVLGGQQKGNRAIQELEGKLEAYPDSRDQKVSWEVTSQQAESVNPECKVNLVLVDRQEQVKLYTEVAAGTSGADDAFSQAESSIGDGQASASAQGKKNGGTAKTQVSGTYSSGGTFSASAMTSDADRAASAQVTGNADGAVSQSQGSGGPAQSQAQVQVAKDGGTKASSQSGGIIQQSQSEVHANDKGGLADAQSSGPGQTSSQAQIGFRPGQEANPPAANGGGQASSSSGTHSSQSSSQIHGTSSFGVSYHGAAQSASGTKEQVATYREANRELFNTISQFGNNGNAVTDRADAVYSGPALTDESDRVPEAQLKSTKPKEEAEQVVNKPDQPEAVQYDDEDEAEPDEYDDDEYYNEKPVKLEETPKSASIVAPTEATPKPKTYDQSSPTQSQQTVVVPVPGEKYQVVQKQNGKATINAEPSTTEAIPPGFRGTVNVEKKFHTKALELHAPKGVEITPDTSDEGPVRGDKPLRRAPDSYVTVTKSVTGSMDNTKNPPQENKNFQSTYYTKSSTCGYFTFSCNIVYGANGRSKICRPKAPTNGKC